MPAADWARGLQNLPRGTTARRPPEHGRASPPIAPPREDGAKGQPPLRPPALWLRLRPGGWCRQALHNPQRLVRTRGNLCNGEVRPGGEGRGQANHEVPTSGGQAPAPGRPAPHRLRRARRGPRPRGLRQPAAAQAPRGPSAHRPRRRARDRARLRHPARPGHLRRGARRVQRPPAGQARPAGPRRPPAGHPPAAEHPRRRPRRRRHLGRPGQVGDRPARLRLRQRGPAPRRHQGPGRLAGHRRPGPGLPTRDGYLATRYSHPRWIVAAYRDALGDRADRPASEAGSVAAPAVVETTGGEAVTELEAALAAGNARPRVTLATFPGGPPREESCRRTPTPAAGPRTPSRSPSGDPAPLIAIRRGRRPGRGQPAGRDRPRPRPAQPGQPGRPGGERWLDMCAGPGGKSRLLYGLPGSPARQPAAQDGGAESLAALRPGPRSPPPSCTRTAPPWSAKR